jgi:magnesium chelatase family protein
MLAQRLPTILPPLSKEEGLEVTRIYSAAGRLPASSPMITARPFRAPHHTTTVQALVGGGSPPTCGEVSLAHLGVLFLDEAAEFHHDALEALRQPLEEGRVIVVRVAATVVFPARCAFLAAMNPCKCGHWGDARQVCTCTPSQRARYRARVSGPLLDRIDLHVEMPAVPAGELMISTPAERSDDVRARVTGARGLQAARGRAFGIADALNATMPALLARAYCALTPESQMLLRQAVERFGLSPRAYHRLARVARTIADLQGEASIQAAHVAEAIGYRTFDRSFEPDRVAPV